MTTHSPAPWIFNGDAIVDVEGRPIASNPAPDTVEGEARWQADAPVIAATPLLLEAVKGAIGEVEADSAADVLLNNALMVAEGHVTGVNVEPLDRRLRQMRSDLDAAVADRNTATARLQEVDEKLCGALNQLAAEKARADAVEKERDRLHKLFDDAGEGTYNVLALVDHYQNEAVSADAKVRDVLARADDLSRMVAAMGEAGRKAHDLLVDIDLNAGLSDGAMRIVSDLDAILSRPDVAAERGRWHSDEDLERFVAHRIATDPALRAVFLERDAAIAARDEAVASTDVYEQRIREIADDVFGLQDAHAASVVLLDAIGRECHRQRIDRLAAERARDEAESALVDAVRRAESAELGCDIAYRREPTQEEGDAHEDKQHQSMGPELATGECFVAMGGWTGRRCRHCGRWVWGGPTACAVCVERASRDELGIQLAAQSERLRLAVAVVDAARALPPYRANMSDLAVVRGKIAAFDAVPGDALANHSNISKSSRHPLDRAHEASGVVTGAPFDEPSNGVKGVE